MFIYLKFSHAVKKKIGLIIAILFLMLSAGFSSPPVLEKVIQTDSVKNDAYSADENDTLPRELLLSSLDQPESVVYNEFFQETNGDKSINIRVFSKNESIDMPKNSVSFWFFVPKNTVLGQNNYLNLHIKVSGTIQENLSTITLAVNDVKSETKWITYLPDAVEGWWKCQISSDLFLPGSVNKITIITTQRSKEGICADIDNPSNWVRLYADSYLHMDTRNFGEPELSDFYSYFYDNFDNNLKAVTDFVVPENPDHNVMNNLLKAASAVGQQFPYKDRLNFVISVRHPDHEEINQRIFVGKLDSWNSLDGLKLPDKLSDSSGYLSIAVQKDLGKSNLLITGSDETGLNKAASFFANRNYMDQINDVEVAVSSNIFSVPEKAKVSPKGFYYLKDFGYDSMELEGLFHQQVNFSIRQPNNIQSQPESYINIKFHHSKALFPDKSQMTIYINDKAINSVKLTQSNADYGNLKVTIPEDALVNELIDIRIDVYNYLGEVDCDRDYDDVAWFVVDKNSEVFFAPGDKGISPTLRHFPYLPVTSEDETDNVMVVLPVNNTKDDAELALLLAGRAGQNNPSELTFNMLSSFENSDGKNSSSNIVFLGETDKVSLPEEVEKELTLVPKRDGTYDIRNRTDIIPEILQNKFVIQAIRSPYNFYKYCYVITWAPSMFDKMREYLQSNTYLGRFSQEIVLVGKSGNINQFSRTSTAAKAESQKVPFSFDRLKYLIVRKFGIPVWAVAVFLIISILFIMALIRLIHSKYSRSEQKKKMEQKESLKNIDSSYKENEPHKDDQ